MTVTGGMPHQLGWYDDRRAIYRDPATGVRMLTSTVFQLRQQASNGIGLFQATPRRMVVAYTVIRIDDNTT